MKQHRLFTCMSLIFVTSVTVSSTVSAQSNHSTALDVAVAQSPTQNARQSLSERRRAQAVADSSVPCSPKIGANSFVGVPTGKNVAGGAVGEGQTHSQFAGVVAGFGNQACGSYTGILAGENNVVGNGDFMHSQTFDSIIAGGAGNSMFQADDALIGAGTSNQIHGYGPGGQRADASAIVGGQNNAIVGGVTSFIGSGTNNTIKDYPPAFSGALSAFIGGGDGNTVAGDQSSVVGGGSNSVNGQASAIVGGINNVTQARNDFIGGGYANHITVTPNSGPNGSALGVIAGGSFNSIASASYDAAYFDVIGGGTQNTATGLEATIAGGYANTTSGKGAAVPGGSQNVAAGIDSFAAGTNSYAKNDGSFVFSDDAAGAKQLVSAGNNEFLVRASGGVAFYSDSHQMAGVVLRAGSGSWSSLSDRASKTDVVALDPSIILAKVAVLPITEWSYRSQDARIRHVGPMAQDFYAAFGIGEDDRHITTIDEDGVALAAIKGLASELARKDRDLRALDAKYVRLEQRLRVLENTSLAVDS